MKMSYTDLHFMNQDLKRWNRKLNDYADSKQPREKLYEILGKHRHAELNMWVMWAIFTLVLLAASPATLIVTLPLGVYYFTQRQRAARIKAQAEYDEKKQRYDAMDAQTIPIDVSMIPRRGRHAA